MLHEQDSCLLRKNIKNIACTILRNAKTADRAEEKAG